MPGGHFVPCHLTVSRSHLPDGKQTYVTSAFILCTRQHAGWFAASPAAHTVQHLVKTYYV